MLSQSDENLVIMEVTKVLLCIIHLIWSSFCNAVDNADGESSLTSPRRFAGTVDDEGTVARAAVPNGSPPDETKKASYCNHYVNMFAFYAIKLLTEVTCKILNIYSISIHVRVRLWTKSIVWRAL